MRNVLTVPSLSSVTTTNTHRRPAQTHTITRGIYISLFQCYPLPCHTKEIKTKPDKTNNLRYLQGPMSKLTVDLRSIRPSD